MCLCVNDRVFVDALLCVCVCVFLCVCVCVCVCVCMCFCLCVRVYECDGAFVSACTRA